jgi:hypothetical protein
MFPVVMTVEAPETAWTLPSVAAAPRPQRKMIAIKFPELWNAGNAWRTIGIICSTAESNSAGMRKENRSFENMVILGLC